MIEDAIPGQLSMRNKARERARWLADHILPHEIWLRGRLRVGTMAGCDIDDVIQESYARLIMLDSVTHILEPRRYLLQIARNVLLQYIRHSKVVPIELVGDLEILHQAADEPLPDRQAEGRQEWQMFQDAIASLPPRCQQVYRLRKIDGLSQREVAQRLKMSESNVEKHLGRGVERLMAMFGRSRQRSRPDRAKREDEDRERHVRTRI
jgi:RNA polymerase sigma-70 factor (ECF subfamily)